jgi:hypothetical protein
MSEDEKLRYLFNAIPEDYANKFTLMNEDNFTTISKKIDTDINKLAYISNSNNQSKDDQLEIDFTLKPHKKRRYNIKGNYQPRR